jgi:proteasome lid subunit RPN8/RPN11
MEKIIIHKEQVKILTDSCEKAYPYEVCGAVLGHDDMILNVRILGNSEEESSSRVYFSISPMDIYKIEKEAEREGTELIGFFHSHPECEAVPSAEDIKHMIPGMISIIVGISKTGRYPERPLFSEEIRGYVRESIQSGIKELIIMGD